MAINRLEKKKYPMSQFFTPTDMFYGVSQFRSFRENFKTSQPENLLNLRYLPTFSKTSLLHYIENFYTVGIESGRGLARGERAPRRSTGR